MNYAKATRLASELGPVELKKYVDGFAPDIIPPAVALAALQGKEAEYKRMQGAMQGQDMAPDQSVKEQLEQRMGLAQLDLARRQQAMANAPVPGGPVPQGSPQPERQPQSRGLAGADVDFNFAGGGIVAFNGEEDGSYVEKYETPFDRNRRLENERAKREMEERIAAMKAAGNESGAMPYGEQMRRLGAAIDRAVPDPINLFRRIIQDPSLAREEAAAKAAELPQASYGNEGRRVPAPAARPAGLAAAAAAPAAAPRPAAPAAPAARPAAPAGLAAAAPQSELDRLALEAVRNPATAMTPEQAMTQEQKIAAGYGLDKAAGLDRLARIKAMQEQYEKSKPDAVDNLIKMFGQAGQYKGLTGLAPAYTANQAQQRAADMAMAAKIDELMGGVEEKQRAEASTRAGRAQTSLEKSAEQTAQANRERMQGLTSMRGQDITAETSRRGQDLVYKAAMAAAQQRGDNAEIAKINAASQFASRDEQINTWQQQIKDLAKIPTQANRAQIQALENRIAQRSADIYNSFGITLPKSTMPAAPGASSPGGIPADIQALLKQYGSK